MSQILLAQANSLHIPLRDKSIHCIMTSPPYFGVRDYGTATWEGGNADCDHAPANTPQRRGLASSTLDGGKATTGHQREGYRDQCPHCGAVRHDEQLGLEESPDEYVANLVKVFREVKRVLRDDGTCWVNLGDTLASGSIRSDVRYCLERLMKGQPLVISHATTTRITAEGADIPLQDNRFPYRILLSLFGVERITIKQRDNNFCQILYPLTHPSYCWIGAPLACLSMQAADLEMVLDSGYCPRIVITQHDTDMQSELRMKGSASTHPRKKGQTSLPIKETAKPITEAIRDGETLGKAITFNTPLKCFPDIYFVDHAVALTNRFMQSPCQRSNFAVREASSEQLHLALGNLSLNFTSTTVRHLSVLNQFGSLIRYAELYDKAKRKSNTLRPKQELGIPDLVKRALMKDGWICRSTIIWNKPSCMPESVQDRPTRSHEYVLMFSKQARYFYDSEAIKEAGQDWGARDRSAAKHNTNGFRSQGQSPHHGLTNGDSSSGRNARSVWTIPSEPFTGGHYATFPTALAEQMILAGTSAHGVCGQCGAPWTRLVERQRLLDGHIPVTGAFSKPDEPFRPPANGTGHSRYTTQTTEHGWRPTCPHPDAPVVPAIVLDPFCGSATTLLAARALGRHAIGLDLSWPYLATIARERLGLADLARWHGETAMPAPVRYDDLPLFA